VLVVADLRMGLTPRYVFRFVVAEHARLGFRETTPKRVRSGRVSPGDIAWLKVGILGRRAIRPAEADQVFDLKTRGRARAKEARALAC
jgi:inner membrane protein